MKKHIDTRITDRNKSSHTSKTYSKSSQNINIGTVSLPAIEANENTLNATFKQAELGVNIDRVNKDNKEPNN